jgi:hypothetical protein
MTNPLKDNASQKQVAGAMPLAKANIIELSDEDGPVLDPEHDKFYYIPNEELNKAMEERGDVRDTS